MEKEAVLREGRHLGNRSQGPTSPQNGCQHGTLWEDLRGPLVLLGERLTFGLMTIQFM